MTGVFEGVGTLQFSPDNKFCYGYSGEIIVENSADAGTTLLNFTTNSEYIIAEYHIYNNQASAIDDFVKVQLNNITIVNARYQNANELHQDQPLKIVIPPFSTFIISASASGATPSYQVILTGKVKGAIEQENLESITDNNKWASK